MWVLSLHVGKCSQRWLSLSQRWLSSLFGWGFYIAVICGVCGREAKEVVICLAGTAMGAFAFWSRC